MLDKLTKKLEKAGKIRKQRAGFVQIEALLKEAVLDLEEAKKIAHLAERALLLLKGYVPDDGAQHKTVVEMTSTILGDPYRELTEKFETMRRKRNEMTYESGALLSKSEAQKAFSDDIALVKKIFTEAKAQNPQLELKFQLNEK